MWFTTELWNEKELEKLIDDKRNIQAKVNGILRFEIKSHHLFLVSRMPVEFEDFEDPYEGTFSVPSKKPFGNKEWSEDIAQMMGHKTAEEGKYMEWYKENYLRYFEVYLEMRIVMQIALQYARYPIEEGQIYTRKNAFSSNWTLQE